MLDRADSEGMQPGMACAFEIEGQYDFPFLGKSAWVRKLMVNNVPSIPPLAVHWCKMFNEVFAIARGILNSQYSASINENVSSSKQTHL